MRKQGASPLAVIGVPACTARRGWHVNLNDRFLLFSNIPGSARGWPLAPALVRRARLSLALVGIKEAFAQPDRVGRDLDPFIIVDIGDGLFQRERHRRCQAHGLVGSGCAHVRQFLALERIHFQVVLTAVFADDHSLVDLFLRTDEKLSPVLEVEQGIGDGHAVFHRDQDTGATARDRPLERSPGVEHAVQDAGAPGIGEELAMISDEAPRGDQRHDPRLADAGRPHLGHFSAPGAGDLFDHRAGIVVIDVDRDFLDRFVPLAFDIAEQDLWP